MQSAYIFILTFNLFFHLALFGEADFGRDSDFYISKLRDDLIKALYIMQARRGLYKQSKRYLLVDSLFARVGLFFRAKDILSNIFALSIIIFKAHVFLE